MNIILPEKKIEVFIISPRTLDPAQYWPNVQNVITWSERYGCTGVLIFTGNDVYVDPWLVAQTVLRETRTLEPLIAVNPIYMHPFTVAKMISSFAYIYGRKVWLNLVTGTALTYLEALNDSLSHDDRYERLLEYVLIIDRLIEGKGYTNFEGRFYRVSGLEVLPKIAERLRPNYFLAGQSDAAHRVASELGAINMQMLMPKYDDQFSHPRGIHFGVITRAREDEAWEAAQGFFNEDKEGQMILDLSMQNTDSVWKRRMKLLSEDAELCRNGYWLNPFRNFKADCPYLVGDYERVAGMIVQLITRGVDMFIIDLPADEREFHHLHAAFSLAKQQLIA